MSKLPFSSAERILAHRFQTGGQVKQTSQSKPSPGMQVPNSAIQQANAEDQLRVIRQPRRPVVVVSPFVPEELSKGPKLQRYAIRAVRDSINRNEAPLASHVMYYDLSIRNPIERDIGLQLQLSWLKHAQAVVVYNDWGITPAMQVVLNAAAVRNKRIEFRTIGDSG